MREEQYHIPPVDVVALMVPFPAQGHLNQLLHLSRLLLSYNIPIHYACTPFHNRQAKLRVHGWDHLAAAINFHDLPIPPFPVLPPDPTAPLGFPSHLLPAFFASAHLRQPIADLMRRLSCQARKVVVINDSLMGFVSKEASLLRNAQSYTFHSVSAFCCFLHSWERMGKPDIGLNGVKIPPAVPSFDGCFPLEFWDFISLQREQLQYNSGFIYNTSRVIEGDCIQHIEALEKTISDKKHWPLGPFNPMKIVHMRKKHFSIEWLDEQPENSVVYVSFGTTTAMMEEQIGEIATGLRQSGKKFIWVIREADRGNVLGEEGRRLSVPEGFEDYIKKENVGLIVRDWAPQLEILAHLAVGGFVSHCGWNSCMESVTLGKPIGSWPMHSDQPRNTVLVTEVLRLGVVVRPWEARHQIASAEVVESGVRRLMEGDEIRLRAAEIGRAMRRSVEEGGVSRAEWGDFVAHISK